jgi:hypothetical protein
MLFLGRILLTATLLAGLGYGALHLLVSLVEPEPREMTLIIPLPRP